MHRSAILNGAAVMGLMCWLLSPAAATKLVTTPEEAVEVLKNKTPATISPCLITSSGAGADFIGGYPAGFNLTWLSDYHQIEAALTAVTSGVAAPDLQAQIIEAAGLDASWCSGGKDGNACFMTIVDGCNPIASFAPPTVSEWMTILSQKWNIDVPMPVVQALAQDGSNYTAQTNGCDYNCSLTYALSGDLCHAEQCGCPAAFCDVYTAVEPFNPWNDDDNSTTEACFKAFESAGPITKEGFRAALQICEDVNPVNTFMGMGADTNTLALTFPEYVMENKPIEEYKAAGLSVAVFPLCKDGSTDC